MKKLVLVAALAAIVALPLNAMAAYYTLSVAQLHAISFDGFLQSGTITNLSETDFATGTKKTGDINNPGGGFGRAGYTLTLFGADLSAYDGFGLCLTNVNENPWDLAIYAEDGTVGWGYKWANNVAVGQAVYLTETWAGFGVDGSDIAYLGFAVRGTTPLGASIPDYTYEVAAQPLPEPGTLALFGFGLAGAAASYRRKRAAKKA